MHPVLCNLCRDLCMALISTQEVYFMIHYEPAEIHQYRSRIENFLSDLTFLCDTYRIYLSDATIFGTDTELQLNRVDKCYTADINGIIVYGNKHKRSY